LSCGTKGDAEITADEIGHPQHISNWKRTVEVELLFGSVDHLNAFGVIDVPSDRPRILNKGSPKTFNAPKVSMLTARRRRMARATL
jgi:hypothetical protein